MSGISLNGAVYDFPVDGRAIGREDILNIYNHLMKSSNIKQFLDLLSKCLLRY